MSFEFHVDSENKIVRLVFDETTSSEERIKALDEIVEIAVKNPSLNLILDVSQYEDYLSDDEKLNFGESLASKKEYFKNSKTAVITKKGRRGYSLILASAYSKGFNRIVEFGNLIDADQWLKGIIP
jgi:hypothetical protein